MSVYTGLMGSRVRRVRASEARIGYRCVGNVSQVTLEMKEETVRSLAKRSGRVR